MATLRRRLVLSLVAIGCVNLASAPGNAQQSEPFLEADPATVPFGGETTVRGRGFVAGVDLELRLDTPSAPPLLTTVVGPDGTIEAMLALGPAAPGRHQLIACTVTRTPCAQRAVTDIIVLEPPRATPTTTIPPPAPPPAPPPPAPPPRAPGPDDVAVATTTTGPTAPGADDLAVATLPPTATTHDAADDFAVSTTIGLDPPFDPTANDFAVTTTTEMPSYVPPNPLGNASLAITAVEVTQGTQNLANDMTMVAGRRTVARVYVETDGDDALVRGRAGLFRNGALVATLDAHNQPVHATADGGDRLDIDSTLMFTLPLSWTTAGSATLSFFVYEISAQHTLDNDVDPSDNFFDVVTHFFTAEPLSMVLVPVHVHDDYSASQPELTWDPADNFADTVEIINGVRRYLPIANIDAVIWPDEAMPLNHQSGNEFDLDEQVAADSGNASAPHERIAVMRDNSTYYTGSRWYGTLPPSGLDYSLWSDNAAKSIGWGGLASTNGVSIGLMSTETRAASPWRLRGSYLIGHEFGHNFGLGHVDCVGTEEDGGAIDPDFPTPAPNCSMAPVDPEGWYGFDVYGPVIPSAGAYEVISNDPAESEPNVGWPLMSYARPEWLDPYAFCALQAAFLVPCLAYGLPEFGGIPGANPAGSAQSGVGSTQTETIGANRSAGHEGTIEVHSVAWSAVADPAAGTGSLTMVKEVPDGPATPASNVDGHGGDDDHAHADGGDHEIEMDVLVGRATVVVEVLDAAGDVVGTSMIDGGHDRLPHEVLEQGGTSAFGLGGHIAVTGDPVAVRLVVGGNEVARVGASANAPTIALHPLDTSATPDGALADGTVITWTVGDVDGDITTSDLRFSPDGGARWVSLATGLSVTSFDLDTAVMPATSDGVLQVRVHDGFRTTTTEIAGLTVADQPPLPPLILTPANGARLRPHEPFTIEAQATDATDRTVRTFGAASDQAGALGATTTGTLDVTGLAAGRHVLTVTAIDSAGRTSASTIAVEVGGEPLVGDPAATQALTARADGTLDLSAFRERSGVHAESSTMVLAAAIAIGVLAACGTIFAVRRGRRAVG